MKAADQGKYGQVQQNPQGNYNFPGEPSNSTRALVGNWALTDKVEEKEKTRKQNTHTKDPYYLQGEAAAPTCICGFGWVRVPDF